VFGVRYSVFDVRYSVFGVWRFAEDKVVLQFSLFATFAKPLRSLPACRTALQVGRREILIAGEIRTFL
jgi:hypothetical protein